MAQAQTRSSGLAVTREHDGAACATRRIEGFQAPLACLWRTFSAQP